MILLSGCDRLDYQTPTSFVAPGIKACLEGQKVIGYADVGSSFKKCIFQAISEALKTAPITSKNLPLLGFDCEIRSVECKLEYSYRTYSSSSISYIDNSIKISVSPLNGALSRMAITVYTIYPTGFVLINSRVLTESPPDQ